MKKFLIVLALASVSLTGMAQDEPSLKYSVATNSFWSNWFIQVGVDASVQNPYRSKFADQFHDGRSYGVNLEGCEGRGLANNYCKGLEQ